ncbi:MAG: phage holin family protein [Bacteroidales bacterium]|nr:phage holin family protein [Bacteroidales bacterium]
MKEKLTEEIKEIYIHIRNWLKYEVTYTKLTLAEKMTILGATVAFAFVIMVLSLPILIMLSFALKGVFQLFMSAPLSYLCVAGVWILSIVIIYLFRKKLISDPIAKFITRLFFDKKP